MKQGKYFFQCASRALSGQVSEISASSVLRWYGVALSLAHLTAAIHWLKDPTMDYLYTVSDAICWPQLPGCAGWRFTSAWSAAGLLYFFAAVSLAGMFFFARNKIRAGYLTLLAATALRFAIFCFDYRLMGNYHYMPFLICLLFLLGPNKEETIPLLLCLFYVAAGFLKPNQEWLSGASLTAPSFVHGALLTGLLYYCIMLELFWSWGLLAKNRAWFWLAFGQFLIFHLFSWHIVGSLYPLTMFALISFFPLQRLLGATGLSLSPLLLGRASRAAYAVVALFTLLQLPPHFFSADSTVTGEGRIFSLNMLDARATCEAFSFARYSDHWEEASLYRRNIGVRIRCDPVVFWNYARTQCAFRKNETGFVGLSLQLLSRRTVDPQYHRIISMENFCAENPSYSPYAPNSWILFDPARGGYLRDPLSQSPESRRALVGAPPVLGPLRETWRVQSKNQGKPSGNALSPSADSSGVFWGDSKVFRAQDPQGKERWRFTLGQVDQGVQFTAALDSDFTYFGADNGRLYKVRKTDGRPEWVVHPGSAITSSPLVAISAVYAGAAGSPYKPGPSHVAKVDRRSGETVWTSPDLADGPLSSLALSPKHSILLAAAGEGFLFALDEQTGRERWRFTATGSAISPPTVYADSVFFTTSEGFLYSLRVSDGQLLWKTQIGRSPGGATLVPESETLIVGTDGAIRGIDRRRGSVLWSHVTPGYEAHSAALALSGSAWIGCAERALCEFSASGEVRQRIGLQGAVSGAPAVVEGALYVLEGPSGQLVKFAGRAHR